MTKDALKKAIKDALAETLHEQRGLLYDVLSEVFEEIAMVRAIRDGQKTKSIRRAKVFRILNGNK